MTPKMDVADRLAIGDMITQFFACLEGGDTDGLLALFAEDARLDMGVAGRPAIEGRSAIAAVFGSRPAGRKTRHHWFALTLSPHAAGALARFQSVVYASEDGAPTARLGNLSDTEIELVRDPEDADWRFGAMRRTVVFLFD